jgi:hypothetical protein
VHRFVFGRRGRAEQGLALLAYLVVTVVAAWVITQRLPAPADDAVPTPQAVLPGVVLRAAGR